MTVTNIINAITPLVTAIVGWVGDFAEMIVSDPLLLMLVVAVPLCGIGVGMLRRLINTN